MNVNYLTIIATMFNFAIIAIIIIALYKSIKGIKKFMNRNKELEKKVDLILKKLEEKE